MFQSSTKVFIPFSEEVTCTKLYNTFLLLFMQMVPCDKIRSPYGSFSCFFLFLWPAVDEIVETWTKFLLRFQFQITIPLRPNMYEKVVERYLFPNA